MTREEAIHELREDKALYETDICHASDGSPDGDLLEALDMAIEALKPTFENDTKIKSCSKDSDLISRQDAIETVGDWMIKEFGYLDINRGERLIDALEARPSANRPRGEWLE